MDHARVNELFDRALEMWLEVTGTREAAGKTRFTWVGGDERWTQRELLKLYEDLKVSRDYDPSGLTSFMMLRGGTESYLRERTFSAWQALLDPDSVGAMLIPLKQLRDVLEAPEVVGEVAAFEEELRKTAGDFRLKAPLGGLLGPERRLDLAYLRRDALRSLRRLGAHQFVHGPPPTHLRLRVNPHVYEYWNVQSLLRHTLHGEDGVTMALVRDPDAALFSFFCLVVKSGESVTVLTDRPQAPHPDYKHMARKPERCQGERMEQNWFPYHLLDLKVTEDQKTMYAAEVTALVPVQATSARVLPLEDMGAEEFVWFMLTAELAWRRFGVANERLPELSYLGSMIVNPEELVSTDSGLVRSGAYVPLALAPVRTEDLRAEANTDNWQSHGVNRWMEERYGADIPAAVLNPVGHLALPGATGEAVAAGGTVEPVHLDRSMNLVRPLSDDMIAPWDKKEVSLRTMDPLSFDRPQKLDHERRWAARVNQALVIQGRAMKEFDETQAEVREWWRAAVEARREEITDAVVRGTLMLPTNLLHAPWRYLHREGGAPTHYEAVRVVDSAFNARKDYYGRVWCEAPRVNGEGRVHLSDRAAAVICGGYRNWEFYCADRPEVRAAAFGRIRIETSEGLAQLLGTEVDALPWQLRHWTWEESRPGNQILDRMDPMDWKLTNPWLSLRLEVFVWLSRRAWAARRKALGLPPMDWDAVIARG